MKILKDKALYYFKKIIPMIIILILGFFMCEDKQAIRELENQVEKLNK